MAVPVLVVLTVLIAVQASDGPTTPTSADTSRVPVADADGSGDGRTTDEDDSDRSSAIATRSSGRAGGAAGPNPERDDRIAPESTVGSTTDSGVTARVIPTVPSAAGPLTPGAHVASLIPSGALPADDPVVESGARTWHVVPGRTAPAGTGATAMTYTVEVEDGIQTPEQDALFAAAVDAALADPRSWIGAGTVSLARIDSGEPTFRVSLTSPLTIRGAELCGWEVPLEASCYNHWAGRVLLNSARWIRGAAAYGTDIDGYRTYAVNHEVGHALGYRHEACPVSGAPAPAMMQQSWSTADNDLHLLDPQTTPADGKTCVANPYPRPAPAPPPAATVSTAAG